MCFHEYLPALDSRIDLGQGKNVGPGKFGKKNKGRALNNHLNNLYVLSNKAVGPGKNPKLINVGHTSIPEARVNSEYKTIVRFPFLS